MEINKSTRHQKIIGDFGEKLVCNWLSRSGFEAAVVDHTGIDIIAYNSSKDERLGISVKARTRNPGKELESVTVFASGKDDKQKLLEACRAFACKPWIAIYVETRDNADLYLTSLVNYEKKYCSEAPRVTRNWKMKDKDKRQYDADLDVKHIKIDFSTTNWW